MGDTKRKLALLGAVAVTGLITRKTLAMAWEAQTDEPAPKNPAAPGVTWSAAITWGVLAGVVVGLTNTLVRRGMAAPFDGELPPDL